MNSLSPDVKAKEKERELKTQGRKRFALTEKLERFNVGQNNGKWRNQKSNLRYEAK